MTARVRLSAPRRGVLRTPGRGLAAAFAALVLALALPARLVSADADTDKAEMLWNIAKFIEWPDETSGRANVVFTILGEDDLAAALAGVLSSKSVNGRPVFVRFARRAQDVKGSQILYVAASEQAHVADVLQVVGDAPVLTVADAPGFASHGGIVGFTLDGGQARFEINLGRAQRSKLKISSKLLALAHVVDAAPAEGR